METVRVNEETSDGNYVIETLDPGENKWMYITTEFSASTASYVMMNLWNATHQKCRVLSRRSSDMLLAETE